MEIMSKTKGKITIDEKQIYTIPNGLFGFEDYCEYALFESEQTPFLWFQSTQKTDLAFLLIDPFFFCSEYELDIDDDSLCSIGITSPSDVLVLSIVTIPTDGSAVTANLQGPLIFNKNNKKCIQVISSDSRWCVKHDILKEARQGNSC